MDRHLISLETLEGVLIHAYVVRKKTPLPLDKVCDRLLQAADLYKLHHLNIILSTKLDAAAAKTVEAAIPKDAHFKSMREPVVIWAGTDHETRALMALH